jgi:hypothetical protein
MYPIPELAQRLEKQWAELLSQHFSVDLEAFLAEPVRHMDFRNQSVRVELMDGSAATFRWAFPVVDEQRKTIAVFTEHCGHHLFPIHDARVSIDERVVFEHRS